MKNRHGLTLVELLVVITIIGVLMALVLPAVQAAREAARHVQCKNNLKELALAAIAHQERHGHYPTGGWGFNWVGDADRGFGQDQPGGWMFNILPFVEETALRDHATDGKPGVISEEQLEAAGNVAGHSLDLMHCPSRRGAKPYPTRDDLNIVVVNARLPLLVGKLDYAINAGDAVSGIESPAPKSLEEAKTYLWSSDRLGGVNDLQWNRLGRSILTGKFGMNGVSFRRSEVGAVHVTDGISNTYLIGEKHVYTPYYETIEPKPEDPESNLGGDTIPWSSGYGLAVARAVLHAPIHDDRKFGDSVSDYVFGSAHPAALHMAYCDGSVRAISYDIANWTYTVGGNRSDGTIDAAGGYTGNR